jgi:Fe-S-cluster containining protein
MDRIKEIKKRQKNLDKRLDAWYKKIEDYGFECQGKCQMYCGDVAFFPTEKARLASEQRSKTYTLLDKGGSERMHRWHEQEKNGVHVANCRFLTKEGRCSIYDKRPGPCRLFGLPNQGWMECHFGCKPVILSKEEYAALEIEMTEIGGLDFRLEMLKRGQ